MCAPTRHDGSLSPAQGFKTLGATCRESRGKDRRAAEPKLVREDGPGASWSRIWLSCYLGKSQSCTQGKSVLSWKSNDTTRGPRAASALELSRAPGQGFGHSNLLHFMATRGKTGLEGMLPAPSWCQSWGGLGNAPCDPLWSSRGAHCVPEPWGSAQGWWLALNHENQQ